MKKQLLIGLMACSMVMLTACHNKKEVPAPEPEPLTAEDTLSLEPVKVGATYYDFARKRNAWLKNLNKPYAAEAAAIAKISDDILRANNNEITDTNELVRYYENERKFYDLLDKKFTPEERRYMMMRVFFESMDNLK